MPHESDEDTSDVEADGRTAAALPSFDELLELSGEHRLDQIRELVLRERGLVSLGSLLQPLCALEVLSLSNNALRSLDGCATMRRLLVLNVNFNRITSLEPLCACPSLTKLYASTNKVASVAPLAACPELRVISLFRNRIASLDRAIDTLRQLPLLEELDLAANPAALGAPYRHRLVAELQLTSLDGDTITELDTQMAHGYLEATHAAQPVDMWRADDEPAAELSAPPSVHFSEHSGSTLSADVPPSTAHVRAAPPSSRARAPHTATRPMSASRPATAAAAAAAAAAIGRPSAAGDVPPAAQRPATAHARPSTSAGTARLFRDPYLNSNPILLEYLSAAALERHTTSTPSDISSSSASRAGTASNDAVDGDSSVLTLRRPLVERLRRTAVVMEGCENSSVDELAQSHLFTKQANDETEEVCRIRQLIHRVQELTAERDEAIEKAMALEAAEASRNSTTAALEQLRQENAALRAENANMFTLMDENAELRTEVETLRLRLECLEPVS